jgi:hypothetical protein
MNTGLKLIEVNKFLFSHRAGELFEGACPNGQ